MDQPQVYLKGSWRAYTSTRRFEGGHGYVVVVEVEGRRVDAHQFSQLVRAGLLPLRTARRSEESARSLARFCQRLGLTKPERLNLAGRIAGFPVVSFRELPESEDLDRRIKQAAIRFRGSRTPVTPGARSTSHPPTPPPCPPHSSPGGPR